MRFSRREFGRLTLAGVPGVALATRSGGLLDALAQSKPNSLIDGVQIGTITYSYRNMPDQSAEATLKYIVDSGISAIELMGGPVETFAGAPASGRGGGPGRGPAGPGGPGGGRGPGGAPPAAADIPPGAKTGSWNGVTCAIPTEGDAGRAAPAGGGRGRGGNTPEQQAAQQEAAR